MSIENQEHQKEPGYITFYNERLAKFGSQSPETLGWKSLESQQVRFEILSQIGNLSNSSILDVGCGLGDLYESLRNKAENIDYLGLDVNPNITTAAQKKYQDAHFICVNFSDFEHEPFDYVLASGALSMKTENYKEIYTGFLQKMFTIANKGVAVNFLNRQTRPEDDEVTSYAVPEVYDLCLKLTNKLVIRQDYLPTDFTVYLYK